MNLCFKRFFRYTAVGGLTEFQGCRTRDVKSEAVTSRTPTFLTEIFVKTMKIDPEKYFSKVIYSGSHESSILAIKAGKIDVASTNDLDIERGNGKQWDTDKD